MSMHRRIIFLLFDGFELLDMAGPSAVFSTAHETAGVERYEVILASVGGGSVRTRCGVTLSSTDAAAVRLCRGDTLLVMGAYAPALTRAMSDMAIKGVLAAAAAQAGRFGSVCTGTFLLGAAGLLNGRRVTTHWAACGQLAARFADARVEPDALYVADGALWTSAGVTTGIDMAVEMLRRDHGHGVAMTVARQLVVYAHRPGNQSQFSTVLHSQAAARGTFADLPLWVEQRLAERVGIADMAAREGMSERSFQRKFSAAFGVSPGAFVERLRLEQARRLIEAGEPIKAIAAQVGFRSESALRTAFRARFGVTPGHHARMCERQE